MASVSIVTNIPQRMDRLPWARWHWMIVTALGVTWLLDGLEVTIVGALGAVLTYPETLNLTVEEVGLSASAYLLGTVAGALVFSYLTDRQGRKRWFLITLIVYLVATVLTAISWNFWSFMFFRFVAGAGIGGEYSAVNSAIDELIPARARGHTDLAINGSWWLGTVLGALISIPLLNIHLVPASLGWRLCFALGAVLGMGILLVRRFVPESPRWLIMQGQNEEAEKIVRSIESQVLQETKSQRLPEPAGQLVVQPGVQANFRTVAEQLFRYYPRRAVLGISLMVAQSILYNATFFTYALVLSRFFAVPADRIGLFLIPFAVVNFCGPLLLGRLFDSVGRKPMITLSYGLSGVLLALSALFFVNGAFTAVTLTLAWSLVFFVASAGASAAYLTVSEIFPLEIRAMAIAFFFVIGQGAGTVAPWIFGRLIDTSALAVFYGYCAVALLMIAAAAVTLLYGVKAERRSLEEIALPLSARRSSFQPTS